VSSARGIQAWDSVAWPLLYSDLLDVTGGYGIGFVVFGIPALLVEVRLLRRWRAAKT
jgi:hypothetical protein